MNNEKTIGKFAELGDYFHLYKYISFGLKVSYLYGLLVWKQINFGIKVSLKSYEPQTTR